MKKIAPTPQEEIFSYNHKSKKFTLQMCKSDMGATDVWKVLKALSLIPVKADVQVRNVFILSDGHFTEEELSLELVSSIRQQSRIFTLVVR